MKFIHSFKRALIAESYLFKLMIKLNSFLGILNITCSIIGNLWPLGAAWVGKLLLDELTSVYSTHEYTSKIFLLIGMQLGMKILQAIVGSLSDLISEYLQNKAALYVDMQVMNKVAEIDIGYFDDPKNRDAIYHAEQSKNLVTDNIGWSVSLISNIIAFFANVTAFFVIEPVCGIAFLLTYIPGTIINNKNKAKMKEFSIRKIPESRKKDYYRSLLTSSETAKDLRLYNLSGYFKEKYSSLWNDIRKQRFAIFKSGAIKLFMASLLTYSGIVGIIIYSVCSFINTDMTLGDVELYISLAINTGYLFERLLNSIIGHFKWCIPQVCVFLDFMNYGNKPRTAGEKKISSCPTIEFRNVSFKYPNSDKYVLKNISFKIGAREKVALVGINGAGKTTLLKLLMNFYEPESGEILIDGSSIADYSPEDFGRLFGTCFQDINHYSLTVRENIALSDLDEQNDESRLDAALSASGADKIVGGLADGYDAELTRMFSDTGAELSGGQWQKLAIARAFFSNAPIIILDEPSSALDPEAEDEIFRSFKKLCKNRSGILVSHRLSSTMLVDKIILIENGELLEMGSHHKLMELGGRYAELYHMQADKYAFGKDAMS